MSDIEMDKPTHPFHLEGGQVIFDPPQSQNDTPQEKRDREKHEFDRKQVKTNERISYFTGLLFIATVCGILTSIWQGCISQTAAKAARDSADAATRSIYLACLSTQANQITISQMQRGAEDAHVSAIAAVEQARAGIEAERAIITFTPRTPNLNNASIDTLPVAYSFSNEGKSSASKITVRARADMYKFPDKKLKFSNNIPILYKDVELLAGGEIPEKPKDGSRAPTPLINVTDASGNGVAITSPEAIDWLQGGVKETVFIYGNITYEDSFGYHEITFCRSSLQLRAGESRKPTENNLFCQKYIGRKDTYFRLPNIKSTNALIEAPKNIECTKNNE